MLELLDRLPGRFGKRLNTTVILVTAAVEDHFIHALRLRAFGDRLAHLFRSGNISAAFDQLANFLVERTGGDARPSRVVVNHLRANVPGGTMYAQAWPLGGARNPLAHPHVYSSAVRLSR